MFGAHERVKQIDGQRHREDSAEEKLDVHEMDPDAVGKFKWDQLEPGDLISLVGGCSHGFTVAAQANGATSGPAV
jgi:hypothetical protein